MVHPEIGLEFVHNFVVVLKGIRDSFNQYLVQQ